MGRRSGSRRRRVLVSFVGSSDPAARGGDGPILTLLDYLRADGPVDQVVLLATATHPHEYRFPDGRTATATQKGMEAELEGVRQAVVARAGGIAVTPLLLHANPANVDEVLRATVEGLRGLDLDGCEVHYNISSGTQAMSAVVTFLADFPLVPRYRVWQVFDPSRVPDGFPRVRPVNFAFLSEQDRLDRALRFLEIGAFGDAEREFGELARASYLPQRRPRVEAVAGLMRVYAAWDAGEFATAAATIGPAAARLGAEGLQRAAVLVAPHEGALRVLGQARGVGASPAFIRFVYARAHRRHRMGHYSAVAAMARRLYEAALDHFCHLEGVSLAPAGEASYVALEDKQQRLFRHLQGKTRGRVTAPQLKQLERLYLGRIRRVRNQCLDEHGTSPVSEAQSDALLKTMEQMLTVALPGASALGDVHLMPGQLLDLAGAIRDQV